MFRFQIIALSSLASFWACRTFVVEMPSPEHRLSGVVHLTSGAPADGGIVIVTNPATKDEIAVAGVTSRGRFVVDVSVPRVALTVTTARGSVFLPKVNVGGGELAIQLSNACTQVRGRVEVDGSPPPKLGVLRIGRLGNEVGDTFGAPIDRERKFEACLSPAEYFVFLSPEFVERTILTMVPARAPLHVHTVTKRQAATPPAEPLGVSSESQADFAASLPGAARVLGLAESNHGSREFTEERVRLAIALARQRGFTTVMIEAGYGEVLPLDAYIHGASIDVDTSIGLLGYWICNTSTFRKALEMLRDYNRGTAPERRVSIVGIDMQSTSGALDDLTATNTGLAPLDSEMLSRLRERRGAEWRGFTPDQRRSAREMLEKLAEKRDSGGLASEVNRHALSARSLLLRLDLIDAQHEAFWNSIRARDRGMARMIEQVLDTEPGLRATLWAHLGHLARESVVGAPTLGEHLAGSLGEGYQVFALLAYEGSARARDLKKELGVISHPLTTAPTYTLEGALAHSAHVPLDEITYWSFGNTAARRPRWLTELHWIRSFGATYPGDEKSFEIYDLQSIDGAVLFKTVTPTEPLATSAPASKPSP